MIRILSLSIILSFMIIQAGTVNENPSPYVLVPKVKTAPVIDGNLDDESWKDAALLSPFMLLSSDEQAKNQTEVYLAYNEKNLYIAARCNSKTLDPTLQML